MLQEVREFATLNSLGTLQRLLEKFPEEMHKEWVKYSFIFQKQNKRHAKFPELVQFVRDQSEEVNSLYGRALYGANKGFTSSNTSRRNVVLSTVLPPTRIASQKTCPFCVGSHSLSK